MSSNFKKILLIVIVLLVTSFGVLWNLGGSKTNQTTKIQMSQEEAAIRAFKLSETQNQNLEKALVASIEKASIEPSGTPIKFYQGSYRTTDLKLTANETISTLTTYGLAMATALKPLNEIKGNGSEIMLQALDNHDQTLVSQIANQAKVYKGIETRLTQIETPKSAVTLHLTLLNSLHKMSEMLGDMSQVLVTPQLALKSGIIYQSNLNSFYQSLVGLNQFFSKKGITFRDQDQLTVYINAK